MPSPCVGSSLLASILAVHLAQGTSAQSEQVPTGSFEPAFNHVVPDAWKKGQPGWDGEPDSPYRYPDKPVRFMASHLSLIPRGPFQGQLLAWNHMRVMLGEQYWAIVDPVNKKYLNYSMPSGPDDEDMFCSGHAWTAAGDLFVAGGNLNINGWISASQKTYRFVPSNAPGPSMWVREPDLALPRWYPTVTAMGDGTLVVIGGTRDTEGRKPFKSFEVFDPSGAPGKGTFKLDPSQANSGIFPGPKGLKRAYTFGFYPRAHLLMDGSLFFSGMNALGYRLSPLDFSSKKKPHWDVHAKNPGRAHTYVSSVLMPNLGGPMGGHQNMVMRLGGTDIEIVKNVPQAPPFVPGPPWAKPTDLAQWIQADLPAKDPNWIWQDAQSLTFARERTAATLLPDATILASGGKLDTQVEINCGVPVLPLEIFDVATRTWRTDASMKVRRGYHSTVALLPDGRVLLAGGEAREMDYEIYLPPYLNDGSSRPRILHPAPLGGAWEWGFGESVEVEYELADGVQVLRGVLMAPASTTHHSDMHQRYVELELLPRSEPSAEGGAQRLSFKTPPNSNHAPSGYYMLFLVTEQQGAAGSGTPSEAAWVKLR